MQSNKIWTSYIFFTWKTTEEVDVSPCFEEPKPEPLHNLKRMLVTGIQDLLSNADNKAFGNFWVAARLVSKETKYSLYCTNADIDWRSRSFISALDILGSLKCVTTNVTWWKIQLHILQTHDTIIIRSKSICLVSSYKHLRNKLDERKSKVWTTLYSLLSTLYFLL